MDERVALAEIAVERPDTPPLQFIQCKRIEVYDGHLGQQIGGMAFDFIEQ